MDTYKEVCLLNLWTQSTGFNPLEWYGGVAEFGTNREFAIAMTYHQAHEINALRQGTETDPYPFVYEFLAIFLKRTMTLERILINCYGVENFLVAKLVFTDRNGEYQEFEIAANDALVINERMRVPVYADESVFAQFGYIVDREPLSKPEKMAVTDDKSYEKMTSDELEKTLQQLTSDEKFEEAAEVRNELNKRKN